MRVRDCKGHREAGSNRGRLWGTLGRLEDPRTRQKTFTGMRLYSLPTPVPLVDGISDHGPQSWTGRLVLHDGVGGGECLWRSSLS